MKQNLLLLTGTLLFLSATINGQQPTGHAVLDINRINASFNVTNNFFIDSLQQGLIEVEDLPSAAPAFGGGLWIGTRNDSSGNIKTAVAFDGISDFTPGPIDTVSMTCDSLTQIAFNRVWKINQSTIDYFRYQYSIGNVSNGTYTIPLEIASWPGNGLPTHSKELAPYFDTNADNFYNPLDGDYPVIRGNQELFFISNDLCVPHFASNSPYSIGLEVHTSVYGFNCPQNPSIDSLLNYTIFLHFDVYNRTSTNLNNTYFGINNLSSLGNPNNDYIAFDVLRNAVTNYNSTNLDSGLNGYGVNPPEFNCVLLTGPASIQLDGIDNDHDGSIDELDETWTPSNFQVYQNDVSVIGNPSIPNDFYNYLHGFWRDNSPLEYGSSGYQTPIPGGTLCDFMYPGTSDVDWIGTDSTPQSFIWTEEEPLGPGSIPNVPGARQSVMSMGPFNMEPYQKTSFDIAYLFTWYKNLPNGPNTSDLLNKNMIDSLLNMWANNTFPCIDLTSQIPELAKTNLLTVYPNPTSTYLNISFSCNTNSILQIVDQLGNICSQTKTLASSKFTTIDISDLSNGLYYVTIISNDGAFKAERFSVAR